MPEDSKVGWWMVGGGLVGIVLGIVLIFVGVDSHPKNIFPIIFGAVFLLVMAYVIIYGIKKLITAANSS